MLEIIPGDTQDEPPYRQSGTWLTGHNAHRNMRKCTHYKTRKQNTRHIAQVCANGNAHKPYNISTSKLDNNHKLV